MPTPTFGGRHVPATLPIRLSNPERILLEPLLASPQKRGRQPKPSTRRTADAVFYLLRSGCSWRMLPREYAPWQTVYYHFREGRLDRRLRPAHCRLRACGRRCARRKGVHGTLAQLVLIARR